ncbi:monocarboxylate transporter 13-like [Anneissia japonica]|uniref:monocarboxylate transporter 13-like n=1 Tax=Anneissia japonica TaxID=1529436 RepID=UPI00142594A6|nr:monocarboxylate transporter 13-like [Anneissia japonica]
MVVLVATFIIFLFFSGLLFSYNLLYIELKQSFNSTTTQTGIPGAISISLFCFGSVVITILFQKLGHRTTVLLGVSLCCLSLLLSSFAQHISVLYFTYGVMYGIGFNACNIASTDLILRSFDKCNATRATSTTLCAISIGFLASPCLKWLYETYSWRIAFRILCVVFALVGYPSALVMVEINKSDDEDSGKEDSNTTQETFSIANYSALFRRRDFILCLIGILLSTSAVTFTLISVGNYLSVNGMDLSVISFVLVLMGVGDLAGRIIAAIFSDRLPISRILQNALSNIAAAVPSICLPFISTQIGRIVAFTVMSVPRAWLLVLTPSIAMEVSSDETRAESVAALYMAFGAGAFITTYFTDAIYDITGSYDMPWFICTGLYALSTLCMVFSERARRGRVQNDVQRYDSVDKCCDKI